MIRSMTGFGRGIVSDSTGKVTVEMKSVNHRYLDISLHMPRIMNAFEPDIRKEIGTQAVRGKIDVVITYEASAEKEYTVVYNKALASQYLADLKQMADDFSLKDDITVTQLSRYPDVLEVKEAETDEDHLRGLVMSALEECLNNFVASRSAEGERLAQDLTDKIHELDGYVTTLEDCSPQIVEEYKARLMEKTAEFLEDNTIDPSRIAAEVTIYADKICIDEEMVRLHSHVREALNCLTNGTEVGRKMDFLAQEMNREANTILSKSTDASIADIGISMKTLIEKIREQIQNLE